MLILTLKDTRAYYFILDTDEEFIGEFPDMESTFGDAYSMDIHTHQESNNGPLIGCAIRLIRHQPGIRYERKHAFIWVGDQIINRHEYSKLNSICRLTTGRINHTPHERAKAWNEADGEYIRTRAENQAVDPPTFCDELRYKCDLIRLRCNLERFGGWDRVLAQEIKCSKGEFIFVSLEEGDALIKDFGDGFTFHGILKKLEVKQCQPIY